MGIPRVWLRWGWRGCGGLVAFLPTLGQSAALADAPEGSKGWLLAYIRSLHVPVQALTCHCQLPGSNKASTGRSLAGEKPCEENRRKKLKGAAWTVSVWSW